MAFVTATMFVDTIGRDHTRLRIKDGENTAMTGVVDH